MAVASYALVGRTTINKKILFIIVILFSLVLAGELMLPFIEELGVLALEWVHKTLDFLFEDILGMEDDASKKASAWTGFLLITLLVVWGVYKLYQHYLLMKSAFPKWWRKRKKEMHDWWSTLTLFLKLAYVFGSLVLVGILVMLL
ncbi:MAG: hypothetical protein DM484_14160 [Candidatus Methylumidiphilus alinenensis]|uniref:Uncharacterized protein n=1 Tax=Candidatus Methylumidiphilus alinenensis TaxID=2202197 RepID=A0A2W4R006_9GAMM|nr:MAG: hypothetical protein DM484_14160 [Candidatus Methylumidiphilus alinenensis]